MKGPYSGERIDPTFTPRGLVEQHVAAYRFFEPFVDGKKILEIGFGEGYGTAFLARSADQITAIDYSLGAVSHARESYGHLDNVEFVHMNAETLKFPIASFDVILSSQVIEHLKDQEGFLRSLRGLLRQGGTAIVVTPNRLTSLDNPFHTHEFEAQEFEELLRTIFEEVELQGIFGSPSLVSAMTERRKWARRLVTLDFLNLRKRLPKSIVVPVYGMSARFLYRIHKRTGSGAEDTIGPQDFLLGADVLDECLDLFAICRVVGNDALEQ